MKIKKALLVALLVALGFPKAEEWDDATLLKRAQQIPEKVKPEDVPKGHEALYEELVEAVDEGLEIEFDGSDSAPEEDDRKALLAQAEEAGIKVTGKESVKLLKALLEKAEKSGGKSDGPTKKKKSAATAAKKSSAKPATAKKDKTEKTPKKEKAETSSVQKAVYAALTDDWQNDLDIAEKAQTNYIKARMYLETSRSSKFVKVERRRVFQYRLV